MLRLNRNRKKPTKGKSTNKTQPTETGTSRPYEESYNEVILNDLVPEEKRNEFGLQSETPKNNKKKSKKSNGIKLNLGLSSKKNKKSKENRPTEKVKDSSKTKPEKEYSNKDEKIESKPSKVNKDSKVSSEKAKPSKKNGSKAKDESKGNEKSKGSKNSNQKSSNQKPSKQKTSSPKPKQSKGSKATKSDIEENTIKEHNHNIIDEEVKKTPRPVVHPKRRRRQQEQNETTRSIEEVEVEVEEVLEENEEDQDTMGFRSSEEGKEELVLQEKVVEVHEVKSKFEDLIWSEDKFPKNK